MASFVLSISDHTRLQKLRGRINDDADHAASQYLSFVGGDGGSF